MYSISKSFNFSYGHRVWTQTLNSEFTIDTVCACRYQHGHNGDITIHFETPELTNSMVIDFKFLNWFKQWLDNVLDHKFIMDINDPMRPHFYPKLEDVLPYKLISVGEKLWYWVPDTNGHGMLTDVEKEVYDGIVIIPFVPTSENLCKWIYEIVKDRMKEFKTIKVSKVEFKETPKTQAVYYAS